MNSDKRKVLLMLKAKKVVGQGRYWMVSKRARCLPHIVPFDSIISLCMRVIIKV